MRKYRIVVKARRPADNTKMTSSMTTHAFEGQRKRLVTRVSVIGG